jgi:ABC-2 type transport system permease protein
MSKLRQAIKSVIRVIAFLTKELNEIYRQPRLILSLILGPFLVLLIFGAGYQTSRPTLSLMLVVPPELQEQIPMDAVKRILSANFELVGVSDDPAEPMRQLQEGTIDVVQIFPTDIYERVLTGHRSPVEFRYNEINPYNEQWIIYLGYAQIGAINRQLLLETARRAQQEADATRQLLNEARSYVEQLQEGLSRAQSEEARALLNRLGAALDILSGMSGMLGSYDQRLVNTEAIDTQVRELRQHLRSIDQAIEESSLEEQRQYLESARQQIVEIDEMVEMLSSLPPEVLISPLQRRYENVRGTSLDVMSFYAPGVLMLILQHISITLGALTLVRERMLGAFELYRVAPISMLHILTGKYIGYTLLVLTMSAILMGLMVWGLGVPFLGSAVELALLLLLVALASIGIGFLISVVSGSDSQAVQLSMLTLLMSIFFSGFFLPLEHFSAFVYVIGTVIPLTHGIAGAQDILLRGASVDVFHWVSLSVIAVVSFVAVLLGSRWQYQRVT